MKTLRIISAAFLAAMGLSLSAQTPAELVNTTIGTKINGFKSGYCVPGATRPFGMLQFTTPIAHKEIGFCINQVNGGCGHMGNFPTLPIKGAITSSPGYMTEGLVKVTEEHGHAGYFGATVDYDIKAEFTATTRTGNARYTFPEGQSSNSVIIGAGIAATKIDRAAIVITSPRSCEGFADGGNFCGRKTPYTVYFVAEFDADAIETGIWKGDELTRGGSFAEGGVSGAYFTFAAGKPVQYKIGISYVSVENARENLKAENPGWNFDGIRADAEKEWNKLLSKIEVSGGDQDRIIQFYTHLYHAFMGPTTFSDVNGQYRGSDSKIYRTNRTEYTNFSNWDTYRTQIQLISMLTPDIASDVVLSHQHFAEQAGDAFPRWVMNGIETGIMQGDPSAILVCNAWAFGARQYETDALYRIMLNCARNPGVKCNGWEVRPHLKDYIEKGYTNASLQLEYNSADFAISRFAFDARNDVFTQLEFQGRAQNWKNLYNPENGWLQCKDENGNWRPFTKSWDDWDEASYQAYFWMIPFNLGGLIDLMGGKDAAIARLDEHFRAIDGLPFDDWFAGGNEPSFQIPWTYNWVGRPDKTTEIVNRMLNELYYVGIDGVPGNDDLGTMGAWYVFASMGMYPMIPGVGGFTLNTPAFSDITMHLPEGDVKILGGSSKNIYTKALTLDGKPLDRAWVDLEAIQKGATLRYTTSNKPGKWAQTELPPSFE